MGFRLIVTHCVPFDKQIYLRLSKFMHKQKKSKLVWRASLIGFLLFFVFTQILPFIPVPKALAAEKGIKDILKVEWVSSTTLKVTISSPTATFSDDNNNNYNVKTAMDGLYVIQGSDVRDADNSGDGRVFVKNDADSNKYRCQDAGKIIWNNPSSHDYQMVDDDTSRIYVSNNDESVAVLENRVKQPDKNQCIGFSGGSYSVKISQASQGAGSQNIGKWLDSANIQINSNVGSKQAGAVYKISTTNSKEFISQGDDQGACKDVLVITGNDDAFGTPVTIYNQKRGSNSPINKSCGLDGQPATGYISNDDQAATAPPGSGLASDATDVKTCESTGSTILNWIFCGVIDAIDKAVSGVDGVVNNMLSLDTEAIASNEGLHTLWSYFRNIASLLLVIVALVMIIAQSIGDGS